MLCKYCGMSCAEGVINCPACGAPIVHFENCPSSTYVINGADINEKIHYTEEERQTYIDLFGKRIKREAVSWKVLSITNLVIYVLLMFVMVTSFVSAVICELETYPEEEYYYYDHGYVDVNYVEEYDQYEEEEWTEYDTYILMFMFSYVGVSLGFWYYIPSSIIGFVMSARISKARKRLYSDCTFAIRRCTSPLSIILGALFQPLTLIFSIPLFATARRNRAILEETARIQKIYYSAQSYRSY